MPFGPAFQSSIPEQPMWDICWTQWQWERYPSNYSYIFSHQSKNTTQLLLSKMCNMPGYVPGLHMTHLLDSE